MEDAPKLLKIPKSECPDIWIRLPRHKWPKSWSSMEDPVVPLERNLYGHPLAGLLWEGQFEKSLLEHGWEKVSLIGNAYSYTVRKDYSYLCMWMTSNWLERNKTLIRFGKYSIKKLIWENQHLSLIMFLGMYSKTMRKKQRYCGQLHNHVRFQRFRRKNGETTKLGKQMSTFVFDMEGHAKKCVERYCELANRTTQQLHKVSTPCIDDHHFKEEELKSVGELSQVCSQIVLKCLYLARIGRPDILWSVNKLARSITKYHKMDQSL